MSAESKVVTFPKQKAASAPKTDPELAANVRRAHKKLCRTIDAAIAAGLDVELRLDASDRYRGSYGIDRVRGIEPRFTRTI